MENAQQHNKLTDLETRTLNTSLQGRYAILGGLSEEIKLELHKKDSILKSKTEVKDIKANPEKRN